MPTGGTGSRAGTRPAHGALEAGLRVRSPGSAAPGPRARAIGASTVRNASNRLAMSARWRPPAAFSSCAPESGARPVGVSAR